jgi:DNA-binding PadR family transcriptional regulator
MTLAELAVLSLVVESPRHGYEIEQVIEERGMREWTDIGFSSIYYILGKLEKQGLLEVRSDGNSRGPARRVFAPSAAGFDAFRGATRDALSTLRVSNPFLLGLSNIVGLSDADAMAALRDYAGALSERLARVERRRDEDAGAPPFVADAFDYSTHTLRAELEWVSALVRRKEHEARRGSRMSTRKPSTDPEITELPARTMAVVRTVGDPSEVAENVFKALYGAAYTLKFALKKVGEVYKVEPPRARWFAGEGWQDVPREQWEAAWALPVPDGTTEVPQKLPAPAVVVEEWEYGTVAQVLFIGAYADEEPTIRDLHAFIEEQGYEIAGPHEEEYLSSPGAKKPKTIIRYQVRKKG